MSVFDGKPILQGVKRVRKSNGLWRLLARGFRRSDQASYMVLGENALDRRREARRRVHLRSGKILAQSERFLVDCGIRNQSRLGMQLRLANRVAIPKDILLFDDSCETLVRAEVIWRRGEIVGCRILETSVARGAELARKLRKPFYAVR
jgi:hypothetical protein